MDPSGSTSHSNPEMCSMIRAFTFTWLALLLTSTAHAKNMAILFGGEDPQNTKQNIFQQSFTSLAGALNNNGWDVNPLFDGDNSHCTDCSKIDPSWSLDPIAKAAGKSASDIPRASPQSLVDLLDRAIDNKSLGAGDQLLIMINTHGAPDYHHEPGGKITDTVQLAVYNP